MRRPIGCAVLVLLAPAAFAQLEPNAGNWKTWIIASPKDYPVPDPPGVSETLIEQKAVRNIVDRARSDGQRLSQIKYWDAGAPGYRWIEVVSNRLSAGTGGPTIARSYAYVAMAMHDATVAVWNAKYRFNRDRPSVLRGAGRSNRFAALLPVPDSPSYPSEYSAVASAAAEVLAALYPAHAGAYRNLAEEAGLSRVNAGLQYPSDHAAGAELGKQIAQAVITRASSDGSTTPFTTPVPAGKCN